MSSPFRNPSGVGRRVPEATRKPIAARWTLALPALALALVALVHEREPTAAPVDTPRAGVSDPARLALGFDTTQGMPGDEARVPDLVLTTPSLPPTEPWRTGVLRVCADPNNLPFSNRAGEGFENRLAELLASELGARVEYTWWAQRRGFFRRTLRAGRCDVVPGMPSAVELALATRPYYRSTYVFVTQRRAGPDVRSFDDPRLHTLRVAVQLVGEDGANTPPAHALASRGIVRNVVGYSVLGDYAAPDPPVRIMEAVARGDVDVAVAWGPMAGWFARHSAVPLRLTPVSPQIDLPFLPFVFDIAVGVRRDDRALRDSLDAVLVRRRADVERLLEAYGVPRVDVTTPRPAARAGA